MSAIMCRMVLFDVGVRRMCTVLVMGMIAKIAIMIMSRLVVVIRHCHEDD